MYDFRQTDTAVEDGPAAAFAKPHALLTASEVARLPIEYASSWVMDALLPARPDGNGRPVLVLPGFYATDGLTRRLRAHLRAAGYHVHGWGLGRNHGLTDLILDGVLARFDGVHRRHGQPVSLVGWSFGGLLARWVAHERPDQVRQVVCMGSPWRAEGERTRATTMFERAAAKHGLSQRAGQVVATLREPLPVLCTAIYSRTDGILHWRSCALDDAERCENIAVPSSHVGLVSNPLALAALTDRLAQDPLAAVPFDWARCLRHSLLGGARVGPGAPPASVTSVAL